MSIPLWVGPAEHMSYLLKRAKLDFTREHKFHKQYKFRFDFALVDKKIAIEVDGGCWTAGRHVRPVGYMLDCKKQFLAHNLGWRVYKIPSDWIMHSKYIKAPKRHIICVEDLLTWLFDIGAGKV